MQICSHAGIGRCCMTEDMPPMEPLILSSKIGQGVVFCRVSHGAIFAPFEGGACDHIQVPDADGIQTCIHVDIKDLQVVIIYGYKTIYKVRGQPLTPYHDSHDLFHAACCSSWRKATTN
eukprot:3387254-Amphidinium_carterae.2